MPAFWNRGLFFISWWPAITQQRSLEYSSAVVVLGGRPSFSKNKNTHFQRGTGFNRSQGGEMHVGTLSQSPISGCSSYDVATFLQR